ncbi:MAG: ribonuclease E/G, partial [Alphaproteobacteria bacterium]|nr:ribonuclease E/G [Alphaproteobacteria bacterium]
PLPSGGYLVINQTEALVAIDVNSGKATKEHSIEKTAQKTNLEAVQEAARQMRLRDLAGLLVLDLIDMNEPRHNRAVERKLKEALKHDRARIRVGRISPFGLLEMSRQRLRASVLEGASVPCEHCNGTGLVRSVENRVLHILRVIEEEADKMQQQNTQQTIDRQEIIVSMLPDAANYILNQKRANLLAIEDKTNSAIIINRDSTLTAMQIALANTDKKGKTKLVRMDGELDMDMPQSKLENRGRRRRGRRGGRRRKADNGKADNANYNDNNEAVDSMQDAKVQETKKHDAKEKGPDAKKQDAKKQGAKEQDINQTTLPNMPELQIESPTETQAEKKAKKATPKKQRTQTANKTGRNPAKSPINSKTNSRANSKTNSRAKNKAKQAKAKPSETADSPLVIKPKDKKKTAPKTPKKAKNKDSSKTEKRAENKAKKRAENKPENIRQKPAPSAKADIKADIDKKGEARQGWWQR